jgi:hypothetical protein
MSVPLHVACFIRFIQLRQLCVLPRWTIANLPDG